MVPSQYASPLSLVAGVFFCLLLLDMFGSSASGSGHQSSYQQFLEHTQSERRMLLQKKEHAINESTSGVPESTPIPHTHNGVKRTLNSAEDLSDDIDARENARALLSQGKGKDSTQHKGKGAPSKPQSRLLLSSATPSTPVFPQLPCFTRWSGHLDSVGLLSGPSGTVRVSLPSPIALLFSFNVTDSYYPSSASLVFPDVMTKQGASRFPISLYGPERYIRNASLTAQDTPSSAYFQAFVSKLSGSVEIELVLKSSLSWSTGSKFIKGKLTPACQLNKSVAPAPAFAPAAATPKAAQFQCSFPGFSVPYTIPAGQNTTTLLLSRCYVAPESVAIATVRASRKAFTSFAAGSQICVPKGCNKALNSSTSPAARSVAETGSSFTYGAYGSYGSRGSYGKKSVAAAYAPAKSKSSMSDTNKAKDAADYPLAPTSTLHSHSETKPNTAASQNRKLPKASPPATAPASMAPAMAAKPKSYKPPKPSTKATKSPKVPFIRAVAPAPTVTLPAVSAPAPTVSVPAASLPTLQQEPITEMTNVQTFIKEEEGQVAPAPSPKAEEEESSLFGALVKTLKENLGISPSIAPEPLAPAPVNAPDTSMIGIAVTPASGEDVAQIALPEMKATAPLPQLPKKKSTKPTVQPKAPKCALSTFPKRYTIPNTCPGYLPNLLLERCGVDAQAVAYASAAKSSTTSVLSPGSSICIPRNCNPCKAPPAPPRKALAPAPVKTELPADQVGLASGVSG